MKKYDKMVKNAAGRMVPEKINGEDHIAYQGVGKYRPDGRKHAPRISSCADYPDDGNKVVADLKSKGKVVRGLVLITPVPREKKGENRHWLNGCARRLAFADRLLE